jgi:hypothetical protein
MRMVVDSNMLQDGELRDFLSKSRKNKAVITDYLIIEALKGDPLGKIFGLMKILCEFPKQVIVLKGLRSISTLKGRRSGMTRRMIEKRQTKGFEDWCAGLAKAEKGDENRRNQLVEHGKVATSEIEKVIAAQSTYAEIIADEAKAYTQDELRILRTDQPYTDQIIEKMSERIVSLTTKFFEAHPDKPEPPNVGGLPYAYIFRLAVCAYLQTLARIRDGGAQNATAEKIANDIVDATFVAQATYFQGLLSKDANANALYRNAKHVLKGLPVPPDKLKKAKLSPKSKELTAT